MNSITVYLFLNAKINKAYIGQTRTSLSKRRRGHIDTAMYSKRKWKSPLHKDILKYGPDVFHILPIRMNCTQEEADKYEAWWIEKWNTYWPNGYNIRAGGLHAPMAESSKAKMRGRTFTPEHRAKLSEKQRGHKSNANQLAALRLGQRNWMPENGKGEYNPNVKLTKEQVLQIRQLLAERKLSQEKIASQFGVKQVTVSAIKRRLTWQHI